MQWRSTIGLAHVVGRTYVATPPSLLRGVSNLGTWPSVTHVINCYGCVCCVVGCCCGTSGRRPYVNNMLLRGIHGYARQPLRFTCALARCIHCARPLAIARASFKSVLSTAAEFYILEAYIPEASLLGSCTNGSKMGCSGI